MASFRPYYREDRGRWEVRVEPGRDANGKRKYVQITTPRERNTKAEANRIGRRILNELEAGTFIEPTDVTLAEYLPSWLSDVVRHQVANRCQDRYASIAACHLAHGSGR